MKKIIVYFTNETLSKLSQNLLKFYPFVGGLRTLNFRSAPVSSSSSFPMYLVHINYDQGMGMKGES